MYKVYILRSVNNGKLYVGSTERPLDLRISEHNSRGHKWTSGNGPFILIYHEEFESFEIARKRENFLKTGKGRQVIANILRTLDIGFTQA